MDKPGFVSLDRTGVNKEAGEKDAMTGFEGFSAYKSQSQPGYLQDEPPPANKQENPDVKKSQPGESVSVPDRYY